MHKFSLVRSYRRISKHYIYLNYSVLIMFLLGFAGAIPSSLIFSTASIWLTNIGINKEIVGLLYIAGLPYLFKFFWAPLLDNLTVPYLTNKIGSRRSVIVVLQLGGFLSILLLSFTNPLINIYLTGSILFIIAVLSASQEVVMAAYGIDLLSEAQQGPGSAIRSLGHRIGSLSGVTFPLLIVTYCCDNLNFCDPIKNWSVALTLLALVSTFIMFLMLLLLPPEIERGRYSFNKVVWYKSLFAPLVSLTKIKNWQLTLLFITTYRISFHFIMGMMNVFWVEVGFSSKQIVIAVKLCGFFSITLGTLIGGSLTYKLGLKKALIIGTILPLVGNYMLIIQYKLGTNVTWQYFNVIFSHICGGLTLMCLITYLDILCKGSDHTSAKFALLTSTASIGRFLFPITSGYIANSLGWISFFHLSIFLGLLPLLLLSFPLIKIK